MSERDLIRCDACGREEHADLIDTKDDGTGNFTIMECIACYGEDWLPMDGSPESWKVSVRPDLAPYYRQWRDSAAFLDRSRAYG